MASLRRLSLVVPIVVIHSGAVLFVAIHHPLPHCHPPPSLFLLSLLPSLLSAIILRYCHLPSNVVVVHHLGGATIKKNTS
jgi:hypothetical protein